MTEQLMDKEQAVDQNITRMFAAIENGDMDTFKSCYTPDAVIWHNHDGVEQNIDECAAGLAFLCSATTNLAYQDQRIVRHGNLYFVEHILTAQIKSGGEFRLAAMMRLETNDDGQITRLNEYFDSRAIDCLMS